MEKNGDMLNEIADRERIRHCLSRLARGEDRRNGTLLKYCFWPDANIDLGVFKGGFDEYIALIVSGEPSILVTLHTLGQSLIELSGNKASIETHVTSFHRIDMGEDEHDVVVGGRYLDKMEKRNGEWRIAHRTMLYDWVRDFGVSADWSQGVMGMPLLTSHAIGSTNGDHSEKIFKTAQIK